jgi:hypothetical protein
MIYDLRFTIELLLILTTEITEDTEKERLHPQGQDINRRETHVRSV